MDLSEDRVVVHPVGTKRMTWGEILMGRLGGREVCGRLLRGHKYNTFCSWRIDRCDLLLGVVRLPKNLIIGLCCHRALVSLIVLVVAAHGFPKEECDFV